jgi:transposase
VANAGMRGRPIAPLVLSQQERAYLERQVRRHRVARSLSERCRAILRCADGLPSKFVAAELGLHEHTVGKWRRRFLKDRCDGLLDEARPGRPRTINDDQVAAVIERTLRTTPADATHWSIRSMAAETGFSHTTIRRMWAAFGLQPHRSQTFKLSSDPLFVDKVRDIVGLYLSPPNRALVLSIDEKSQIQALDREQPVLPMMPGERWFAELTRKQIQRGVHTSVRQLEADIRTFIDLHNRNPKPFKWTKSADQILASVKRFCHKAQQTLCGERTTLADFEQSGIPKSVFL